MREMADAGHVLVVSGGGVSAVFELPTEGEAVLGRDPTRAALVVDHPSLSRAHARFVTVPGSKRSVLVEDLGSKNGVRRGAERLAAGALFPLEVGVVLELGALLVMLVPRARASHRAPRARRPAAASEHTPVITPALAPLDEVLRKVAPTTLPVLLLGETGVGKDVLAERLHALSPRHKKPLVVVHAAAIAESLFESELFGHEAGAFTGALKKKVGLVGAADGGTVFIDEVGELPLAIQVKLLRVVEDRRVQPVGAITAKRVDVRFVAATHRDLAACVRAGTFRQDLFQRLRGVSIRVPPLRERRDDIALLAEAFLRRVANDKTFSLAALKILAKQPFFGNVRELRNVVERTALLTEGAVVRPKDLVLAEGAAADEANESGDEAEKVRVREALRKANGNQTRAAGLLGISRRTLIHRLDALRLERPRKGNVVERPTSR